MTNKEVQAIHFWTTRINANSAAMFRILLTTLFFAHLSASAGTSQMRIETLPGENAVVGGSIKKKCVVDSSFKKVEWLKPNGVRSPGPFLEVNNLQPKNNGLYACMGYKKDANKALVMHFRVTVLGGFSLRIKKLASEKFQIGGSIRRKCFLHPAQKDSDWTFEWNGPNGLKSSGDLLEVLNLQPKNSGKYTCKATHKASGRSWITGFRLKITMPKYQRVQLNIVQEKGNRIVLGAKGVLSYVCQIKDAGWKLHWVKPNGETVASGELIVKNLSRKDLGTYKCIAEKNGQKLEAKLKIG